MLTNIKHKNSYIPFHALKLYKPLSIYMYFDGYSSITPQNFLSFSLGGIKVLNNPVHLFLPMLPTLTQVLLKLIKVGLTLIDLEYYLRMNCSPVCLFVVRGSTGSCGVGFCKSRDAHQAYQVFLDRLVV